MLIILRWLRQPLRINIGQSRALKRWFAVLARRPLRVQGLVRHLADVWALGGVLARVLRAA